MPGLLVLNGGDEFRPGNEPQDRELVAAAGSGPAYVVATAARRQRPALAVANARQWFGSLGLELEELGVYTRSDASSSELAARAAGAGLIYLTGGDPGLLANTLRASAVWAGMTQAWLRGAALAGSSAGAMALCERTLVMARWPRHEQRRAIPALGPVPRTVVLPHYERMGSRWTIEEGASQGSDALILLGLDERTAAVWNADGWHAAGAGGVTVIAGGETTRFESGGACPGIPAPVESNSEQG